MLSSAAVLLVTKIPPEGGPSYYKWLRPLQELIQLVVPTLFGPNDKAFTP
ncbi:hypothetical protein AEST_32050 [Alishewanella aestuarii B11]|uniref:Uncharacterized protein n=1 Tax=Alishewanella aestuarii B11 TaxID=1197174 RepID=J2IBG7_9ALTE|nr:hypothetical protein AEST_32050 [Alishewanella aestuarii B11]